MISAIKTELKLRKAEIKEPLETIYFGGGTPSILTNEELNSIFKLIESLFEIENQPEITLEANPDDLTLSKIKELKQTPINRFSIGIQSFYDEDLQFMNRAHDANQAERSIKTAQDFGFENITIDLIYGTPTTTTQMWKNNIEKTIALSIPHVSAYALTIEPKTVLNHKINKGDLPNVDEALQQEHFNILVEELGKNDFVHYEISNFGKEGFFSKHNSNYWVGKNYVGIGPSAHSFDGKSRAWNVSNNTKYIQALNQKNIPNEVEILTEKDQINELTMIGLRTIFGIDFNDFKTKFSSVLIDEWLKQAKPFLNDGKLILKDNKIYLNSNYRFFADGIASELFII